MLSKEKQGGAAACLAHLLLALLHSEVAGSLPKPAGQVTGATARCNATHSAATRRGTKVMCNVIEKVKLHWQVWESAAHNGRSAGTADSPPHQWWGRLAF